jgi:small subunit ribosomal protein S17
MTQKHANNASGSHTTGGANALSMATTTDKKQTVRRQQKVGRVVSDKMEKTRVVSVEVLKRHRIYKRTYKQTKRFYVHDEENRSHIGDLVRIEESRPLSKLKRWNLVGILKLGSGVVPVEEGSQTTFKDGGQAHSSSQTSVKDGEANALQDAVEDGFQGE